MTKEVAKKEESKDSKEDVKKEETKSYGKWLIVLILLVLIAGYFGYNYILKFSDEIRAKAVEEESKVDFIDDKEEAIQQLKTSPPASEQVKEAVKEVVEIVEQEKAESEKNIEQKIEAKRAKEIEEEAPPQIEYFDKKSARINLLFNQHEELQGKVIELEKSKQHMVLYFAARDLRESLDNEEKFSNQLKFIERLTKNYPAISGKVDLLKHSSANGLPTKAASITKLKALAKKVEDSKERTVWGSVSDSVTGLVKITKIDGEISEKDDTTYGISKRAEIAIEKEKFDKAISEVKKYGQPADEWVKEANNLRRIYEITDYLIEFSKNKVADN